MKNVFTLLLLVTTAGVSYSQCNSYYYIKDGAQWEMNIHDKKGNLDGRSVSKVKEFSDDSDGWDATVFSTYYDKKDKESYSGEFEMACEDGIIKFNMEKMIPQESVQSFKEMDMQIEGDFLELPKTLEVGQTLSDGTLTMKGNMPFQISVRIFDRKVTGKEQITVPAGTFDCYKIEYKMEMKTVMSVETAGVEYVAEKVGVVRQETYNKNGKLTGYTELNSYSF